MRPTKAEFPTTFRGTRVYVRMEALVRVNGNVDVKIRFEGEDGKSVKWDPLPTKAELAQLCRAAHIV